MNLCFLSLFFIFLGGGGAKTSNDIIVGNGRQRFTNELTISVSIFFKVLLFCNCILLINIQNDSKLYLIWGIFIPCE